MSHAYLCGKNNLAEAGQAPRGPNVKPHRFIEESINNVCNHDAYYTAKP